MIAIAVLTRHATRSCTGIVTTPLGTFPALSTSDGFGGEITYQVSQRTACRLQKACFAVAVIGAFLFLVTAGMQLVLIKHHQKEKRYGPSPKVGRRSAMQRDVILTRHRTTTHQALARKSSGNASQRIPHAMLRWLVELEVLPSLLTTTTALHMRQARLSVTTRHCTTRRPSLHRTLATILSLKELV